MDSNKNFIDKNIKSLSNVDLIIAIERLIRNGAGFDSVPYKWYKKELLNRLEKKNS